MINNTVQAQNFSIFTVEKVTPVGENYNSPQWSPDVKTLAFTSEANNGIYTFSLATATLTQVSSDIGAGYKFKWSDDSEQIHYRGTRFKGKTRNQFIASVNVLTKKQNVLVDNNQRRISLPYWSNGAKGKTVMYLKGEKPVVVKELSYKKGYSVSKASTTKKSVINNDNITYVLEADKVNLVISDRIYNPVISPDNTQMVYGKGGELKVYNFSSKEERSLGKGHHASWSPDNKYVVFEVSSDDGHIVLESDLYIASVDGKIREKITSTDNQLETTAVWFPNGNRIAYQCSKTGLIYILTLK